MVQRLPPASSQSSSERAIGEAASWHLALPLRSTFVALLSEDPKCRI